MHDSGYESGIPKQDQVSTVFPDYNMLFPCWWLLGHFRIDGRKVRTYEFKATDIAK